MKNPSPAKTPGRTSTSKWRHLAGRISYGRLLPVIVLLVLVLLLTTILFNNLLATRISREYGEIATSLHKVSILYGKMDLSTRVFTNIQGQISADAALSEDKLHTLRTAYATHHFQYFDHLAQMQTRLERIHVIAHEWMQHPLIRRLAVDPTFDTRVEALLEIVQELSRDASTALPPADSFDMLSTEILGPTQERLPDLVESLHNSNADNTFESADRTLFQVNMVMTTLFLVVLVLAMLLYRLLHHGILYVEKGLNLMNSHRYDPNLLPDIRPVFREEWRISKHLNDVLREQRLLEDVKREASRGYVLQDVLETLFAEIHPILSADRIGVAFIDQEHGKIIAEHGILHEGTIRLGPGFDTDIQDSSLRDIIALGEPVITEDLREQLAKKPHSQSLQLLVEEGICSNMILPLKIGGAVYAFLFISSRTPNRYTAADLQMGKMIAEELSPLLDKTFLTQTIFSRITNSFADLVDRKDNETGDHIQRMVRYSVLIAEALLEHENPAYRTTARFVRDIANNAASHDIGKVAIPDNILKKPGKLTQEEWIIMKTHATVGGDIFSSLRNSLRIFQQQFYVIAENIARYHHERWDGGGYPDGLSGQDIPLEARITAVADVFDALTSKRVYKQAWSLEASYAELERSAGSHLDPTLVSVFLSCRKEIEQIRQMTATPSP